VAQVVEHLPSKGEALSSNHITTQERKKVTYSWLNELPPGNTDGTGKYICLRNLGESF
jgi:hypothetical protein